MARRKTMLSIDFSFFAEYAEKLEDLGEDVKDVFGKSLEKSAEQVQADTEKAMNSSYLPAHGRYATGKTKAAISPHPRVVWYGNTAEVGLGFDKGKANAGSWLITGTPRMAPDKELAKIYSSQGYENKVKNRMKNDVNEFIQRRMG